MDLLAEGVEFAYPRRAVLGGVDASFPNGAVTAVLGPNGSGKTTLLRVLLGVLKPVRGRVGFVEQDQWTDVGALSAEQRARRLAYVPQRSEVAFAFTVRQVVALGRFAAGDGRADEHAERALERVGLLDRSDDLFESLSAGQQQRATLARVLCQVGLSGAGGGGEAGGAVLADEPISAMDPEHALGCMGLLRELSRGGRAVVVVLHDFSLAARFADRALVLDRSGKVAAAGPAVEVLTPGVLGPVFNTRFHGVPWPEQPDRLILTPVGPLPSR